MQNLPQSCQNRTNKSQLWEIQIPRCKLWALTLYHFKVLWEVSYWARDWGAARLSTGTLDWDETEHKRGSISSQLERQWVVGNKGIFNLFFGRSSQRKDPEDRNCVNSHVRLPAQRWPSLGAPSPLILPNPSPSFLFSKMSQNTEVRLCNLLFLTLIMLRLLNIKVQPPPLCIF